MDKQKEISDRLDKLEYNYTVEPNKSTDMVAYERFGLGIIQNQVCIINGETLNRLIGVD